MNVTAARLAEHKAQADRRGLRRRPAMIAGIGDAVRRRHWGSLVAHPLFFGQAHRRVVFLCPSVRLHRKILYEAPHRLAGLFKREPAAGGPEFFFVLSTIGTWASFGDRVNDAGWTCASCDLTGAGLNSRSILA